MVSSGDVTVMVGITGVTVSAGGSCAGGCSVSSGGGGAAEVVSTGAGGGAGVVSVTVSVVVFGSGAGGFPVPGAGRLDEVVIG